MHIFFVYYSTYSTPQAYEKSADNIDDWQYWLMIEYWLINPDAGIVPLTILLKAAPHNEAPEFIPALFLKLLATQDAEGKAAQLISLLRNSSMIEWTAAVTQECLMAELSKMKLADDTGKLLIQCAAIIWKSSV